MGTHTGIHQQLEDEANRILRDHGHHDLAAHPDRIPTTDALAHATHYGLNHERDQGDN